MNTRASLRQLAILAILAIIATAVAACSRPAATPRPRAYPRATVYPATYREVSAPPLTLTVNDSARVLPGENGGFDLVYPAYGVRVYCSLTPVSGRDEAVSVLENRTERMALNTNGAAGQMTTMPGRVLLVTPTAAMTPVQFLATDSATYVLSGAAVSANPSAPVDSLRPQVEALERDILTLLTNLP